MCEAEKRGDNLDRRRWADKAVGGMKMSNIGSTVGIDDNSSHVCPKSTLAKLISGTFCPHSFLHLRQLK